MNDKDKPKPSPQEQIDLPQNPKTDKPHTPEEIAKVLLNTKPKELNERASRLAQAFFKLKPEQKN